MHLPVAVEENHDIRSDQVDTQTTGSGGEQEDKLLASGGVVLVDRIDTIFVRRVSVDTAVV